MSNRKTVQKKKSNMGRVVIDLGYVVDIDNPDMIQEAKRMFYEDLMNAGKYEEMTDWMTVVKDNTLTPNDIPDHLKEVLED